MSKTLLNGINAVLKRVSMIQGDSGSLTSLTDSGRQVYIDLAVQVWNEAVEELYSISNIPMPNEMDTGTITLATGTRTYALASDLNNLRYPLVDQTNGQYITEYPGGYEQMFKDQNFPANFTGLPMMGAINPDGGQFYLDRIPTSDVNGNVYTYNYDKDVSLSAAADTFPFQDVVYRSILPAVAEKWKYERHQTFNEKAYNKSMGIASRYLTQKQPDTSWNPLRRNVQVISQEAYLNPFDE